MHLCCEKDAVYELEDGRVLCPKHFSRWLEKRVMRSIRQEIQPKAPLVLALSGGKDSAVMAYVLAKLRKKIPLRLLAVSVDEGTPYRRSCLQCAEELTRMLGIPWLRIEMKAVVGKSLEELGSEKPCSVCAVVRRRLLDTAAEQFKAKLAVGHNLDDIAQAVIMNLARNEPKRLRRMFFPTKAPGLPGRLRPLMWIEERALLTYAYLHELPFVHKKCPFSARDKIRTEVRGIVQHLASIVPGAKRAIVKSALALAKNLVEPGPPQRCPKCGHLAKGLCKSCELAEKYGLEEPRKWQERVARLINSWAF